MAMQDSFSVNIIRAGHRITQLSDMKSSNKVKDLKQRYVDEIGMGNGDVFYFKGKTLKDNLTLEDCGIGAGSTIIAVIKVIGGGGITGINNNWKKHN